MKELPNDLTFSGALTNLDVSDNQLSSLPPAIGRLTNLTTLISRKNKINELPASVGGLCVLQVLNACGDERVQACIPV